MSTRIPGTSTPIDSTALDPTGGGDDGQPGVGHRRHPQHHDPQAAKTSNRSRAKRKRGGDPQDGIDEESEASEELMMMLEEHLQNSTGMVMRAGERSREDQRDDSEGDGGAQHGGEGPHARSAFQRNSKLRRVASPEESEHAQRDAESALLRARSAQGAEKPAESSTYAVLAAMRDFLALPSPVARDARTLATVRKRLIDAVGTPTSAAPAHQHSMNLLLPLMVLNLMRARTDAERAVGLAITSSQLKRRRVRS